MSKQFNLKLTYKELCILKHALRDKVAGNERQIPMIEGIIECQDVDFDEEFKEEQRKKLKAFQEEKETLESITECVETVQAYIGTKEGNDEI